MKKWNMIIDGANCTNCNVCTLSVQDEHVGNAFEGYAEEMPKHGHRWIKERERGRLRQQMLPICQPCVSTVMMRPVRKPPDAVTKEMTGL